ncbi:MAG: hypothetical protein LUD07_04460 [Clostridiales bacterium]|nr:hypothetical protein [Clostridiales bacterium]
MSNHHRRGGIPAYVQVILLIVACLALGGMFVYANYQDNKESERLKQVAEEYRKDEEARAEEYRKAGKSEKNGEDEAVMADESSRTDEAARAEGNGLILLSGEVTGEDDFLISAYDVMVDGSVGEILVDPGTFCESADLVPAYSGSSTVASMNISSALDEGDVAVLQFKAWTESGSGWMQVSCGEDDVSVWVSETAATCYIPIAGACDISEICFRMDVSEAGKTTIDEVCLVKYEDTAITDLRTGIYTEFGCSTTVMEAENYEIDRKATQCLTDGGYLYALSDGSLGVYRILEAGYEKITEYSGMGDTRDMAFTDDKDGIVVSAGGDGMYVFNVSEPEYLALASHYATSERSTGIFVSEYYAFLCQPYSGVEIVDVSDLNNPAYVNRVEADSEYEDCFVSGGYLYAGVCEQKRVDLYDIRDLSNPSLCSQISLDGNGGGVFVSDGVLYAATSRDSADVADHSSDLSDYGRGAGNGLEIYDVSDPENPVHLSTVKTLGRLSCDGDEGWDVVAAGDYAYLSSRYNGLYVFDVSNRENPVCVDIYQIEANNGSSFYQSMDAETDAFPYETDVIARGCISHVWLQDGCLYAAASNMGIYRMDADYITEPDQPDPFGYTRPFYEREIASMSDSSLSIASQSDVSG